jgi:hypothetical protein
MNIHLPAILMFTRGIGFWPIPILGLLGWSWDAYFYLVGLWQRRLRELNPTEVCSNGSPLVFTLSQTHRSWRGLGCSSGSHATIFLDMVSVCPQSSHLRWNMILNDTQRSKLGLVPSISESCSNPHMAWVHVLFGWTWVTKLPVSIKATARLTIKLGMRISRLIPPFCPSKLSQGIAYAKSYCHQVNHTFNKVQRSWFINLGNAPSWSFQTPWFKAWRYFRRHNSRGLRSMAMTTVAGCYGHLSWVPLHIHQCFGGVLGDRGQVCMVERTNRDQNL